MKNLKRYLLGILCASAFVLTACGSDNTAANNTKESTSIEQDLSNQEKLNNTESPNAENNNLSTQQSNNERPSEKEEQNMSNVIKISFDEGEILIKLDDNSATQDLMSRLPLTVSFEDFNNTEKISYLDKALDMSNAPDECKPEEGYFAYYIPWGNLSLFYKEFRTSPQLAPLGEVISGQEYMEKLDNYSSVIIDNVKN